MNYKIAIAVALLLIYMLPVFAVEVTNINNPNTIGDSVAQIQANAEIIAKINALDSKLGNYATKGDVQGLLEAHLNVMNKIIGNFTNQVIIYLILIGLGLLGLGFGTLFYFKTKGRL